METWHPLDGEIPPDPPDAPWHFEPGDPPAEIIRRMRECWFLEKGGPPEYAQALFEKAGQWLDYLQNARIDASALNRAGIRVKAPARRETWRSYLALAEAGIEGDAPQVDAAESPADTAAQTAVLAIYAAHQAVLTGWRDFWALSIDLSDAAQRRWGKKGVHAAVSANQRLVDANSKRSHAREAGDSDLLEKAREMLASGTSRRSLASILSRQKWPDAKNPQSDEKVKLTADQIRRRLKILLE